MSQGRAQSLGGCGDGIAASAFNFLTTCCIKPSTAGLPVFHDGIRASLKSDMGFLKALMCISWLPTGLWKFVCHSDKKVTYTLIEGILSMLIIVI